MKSNSTTPTLGSRIKELRTEKDLSMRALAELAGLKSVAFVADVEKGFRNPSPSILTAFAKALGVTTSELRDLDSRAPIYEIRAMTEANPAWAPALRRLMDAAQNENLKAGDLIRMLDQRNPSTPQEILLNL